MRLLLAILLFAATTFAFSETYIQLNGASIHDRAGFNSANYGAGIEQKLSEDWNVAIGGYKNSEYNASAYGYARYRLYENGPWNVGVGLGVVTGYSQASVMPMAFPEVCYGYLCTLYIPQIDANGANAIGFHLKIPVKE